MRPNPQIPADLFTFTEETRNGKLYFLCSDSLIIDVWQDPKYNNEKMLALNCFTLQIGVTEVVFRRYSVKKVLLNFFAKFTGKHLCQSLFFNKGVGFRPATLLKERLWHRFLKICEIFKSTFIYRTPPLVTSGMTKILEKASSHQKNFIYKGTFLIRFQNQE